jgi:hypothetical protein
MSKIAVYEIQEALKALDGGDELLARRYLENALSRLRCVICHGDISETGPVEQFYKNVVHTDCKIKYGRRTTYLKEHPEQKDEY